MMWYLFYFILLFNHLKFIIVSYIIWRKAVLKFGKVYSLVKKIQGLPWWSSGQDFTFQCREYKFDL